MPSGIKDKQAVNTQILERFAVLTRKQLLGHAYLFIGPAHIGKAETALAVAQLLNCEQPPKEGYFCGTCPACRKIEGGNHPDVHVLNSDFGETIKIEQVREVLAQSRLRPFMAGRKIFIITNVENLTHEGANALLKTLEEPSASSLLILTTSVPEKNLDTVTSRCHALRFLPDARKDLVEKLTGDRSLSRQEAHFLAYFAEGCLGKARRLRDRGVFRDKDEIITRFILGGEREAFTKRILSDKQKTKEFLDVLLSWVRDCLLLKAGGAPAQVVHTDRIRELEAFQRRFSFEALEDIHGQVVRTCRLLTENLNVKIPLLIIGEMLWAK